MSSYYDEDEQQKKKNRNNALDTGRKIHKHLKNKKNPVANKAQNKITQKIADAIKKKIKQKMQRKVIMKMVSSLASSVAPMLISCLFISTIFTFLTPGNIVRVVGHVMASCHYSVYDTVYQMASPIVYAINPFEDRITSDSSLTNANVSIPIDGRDYDSKNEEDMALLEEYKLLAVALSRAYDKALESIEVACLTYGYDVDKTLEAVKQKYPNGWKDIYKDINYAELIAVMYFYIEEDTLTSEIPENYYEKLYETYIDTDDNVEHEEGENTETYTFSGLYLKKIEDLITSSYGLKELSELGFKIVEYETENTQEEDEEYEDEYEEEIGAYLDIEIKPFSWNRLYKLIEVDPNAEYDDDIAFADMQEGMASNVSAMSEDMFGNERGIHKTLGMGKNTVKEGGIQWNNEFDGSDISQLYTYFKVPEVESNENAQTLFSLLKLAGFNNNSAAGISGTLMQKNNVSTNMVDSYGSGIGIASWNEDEHKEQIEALATEMGLEATSIQLQTIYLVTQLEENPSTYKTDRLKNAQSPEEAADIFSIYYLNEEKFKSHDEWLENWDLNLPWPNYVYSEETGYYHLHLNERRAYAKAFFEEYNSLSLMYYPLSYSAEIIQDFGAIITPEGGTIMSYGADIKVNEGDVVVAPICGQVIELGENAIDGKYMIVQHGIYITEYYHLYSTYVQEGDYVNTGQLIARAGQSGNVIEPVLTFCLKKKSGEQYQYISPWMVVGKNIYRVN